MPDESNITNPATALPELPFFQWSFSLTQMQRIQQAPAELNWSQHLNLVSLREGLL